MLTKPGLERELLSPGQCTTVLKALGDETRLRILEFFLVEECVTDLVQELRCSRPHASHNPRISRDSGLVEGHQCGKQVCYRMTPEIKRALANGQGQALDFGRCELRFPESTLMTIGRVR